MDIQDIKTNMLPMLQQIMEMEINNENRNAISEIAEAFEDVMDKFFADEIAPSADGVELDVGESPLVMADDDEEFEDGDAGVYNEDDDEDDEDNAEEDIEVTTTQDIEHLTVDQLRKLMMTCVAELSYRAEESDGDDEDDAEERQEREDSEGDDDEEEHF